MPRKNTPTFSFGGWDWPSSANMVAFGAGALIMMTAGRLMAPVAGRAMGSMRAMTGADPFEALAQDHQKALALMEAIEATPDNAIARRASMLLQLKRMLTAHALAEEDIIYPMLIDDAHRREQANKLYREHADLKIRLFELEHKAKNDPSWMEDLKALHRIVQQHAQEEEQMEFPKLRAALDEARRSDLMGEVQREKSMLM